MFLIIRLRFFTVISLFLSGSMRIYTADPNVICLFDKGHFRLSILYGGVRVRGERGDVNANIQY